MNGIIGCEESQAVTEEFVSNGHNFNSCDLQASSGHLPHLHIQGDILREVPPRISGLDFLGLHPVCKILANSGVRWLASKKPLPGYEWCERYKIYMNWDRYALMLPAAMFFKTCLQMVKQTGCGYVENPILHKYAMEIIVDKPTQIIQPWMFGHTTSKATCLWLVNLPELIPTEIIPKELRTDEIHKCAPGPDREKIRSKTFPGIAKAMAEQWGGINKIKLAV